MVRSKLPAMFAFASHHSVLSGRQGHASVGFCVDSSQEMERNWMYFRMISPSYRILTLSSFTGGLPPPLRARRARIEATRMVSRDAGVSKKNLKNRDHVMLTDPVRVRNG